MRFSFAAIAGALLAVPAFAQDPQGQQGQMVIVGMNGTLTFTPSSFNAPVGSNVTFMFMSKNHSIAQSSFTDPCATTAGGFQADFFPIATGETNFPTVTISVTQPAPIWIYCPQTNPVNHCNQGMVAAINPTADKTFEAFQATAKGAAAPAAAGTNGTTGTTGTSGTTGATGTTGTGGSAPGTTGGPVVSPGTTSGASPPANTTATNKNAAFPQTQVALTAVVVGVLGVVASSL